MRESGLPSTVARAAVGHLPPGLAGHVPFALGLTAMPLRLAFDPGWFYFGVLPVEPAPRVRGHQGGTGL
jgi:CitMHS family citrate-Mg2+:H+ or citrate-Ca2+:H+ symporter